MHNIELQIVQFIEQLGLEKAVVTDELIEEFGERAKKALKKCLTEDILPNKEFRLRMSNIGRPLRQLMLEQKYGRIPASTDFVLKMLYGSLYEALTIALLKASGVNLEDHDKEVALEVAGTVIKGTLDVIIDGKVYDIKTASPYSYEHKFVSWESLAYNDDFGYLAQGFGYAIADKRKFGGWIVLNKSDGQFKVIEIPDDIEEGLAKKYYKEIEYKVNYLKSKKEMPACDGAEEETYYKKPTGNIILGNKCRFCDHKEKCHPDMKHIPSKASKSENPKYVHYIHLKEE